MYSHATAELFNEELQHHYARLELWKINVKAILCSWMCCSNVCSTVLALQRSSSRLALVHMKGAT